ncbi:oligopeptide/dipeptide ABC transporter ATP-binding protein [Roseovarius sp.]|jgi:peptide/nickel transport system ATP-binding protein|uniref:ABC transporter ATP-binding protein n=1 Tax=Roseovarius sp. TaxID=1486281 RepID=UPI00261BE973|nr:oligopeptide/dipeptide ABC transporter ATP-binding protein [Roseovarius sp.]MDM8165801.1 ATP-binding cassette domain-containing protein [Roseovarius sp.]
MTGTRDDAPIMEAQGLTKTYTLSSGLLGKKRTLHAVRGLDLDLRRGDILGIVGESGCGKSTLSRMLLGLEAPTEGVVRIGGQPVEQIGRAALSRKVQPIFQDPFSSLNPRKTIESIISLPLRLHGIGDAASRRREVREMMERVGLPSRVAKGYPSQLSGGQRQRVSIARALITRPEIVICDEPTSALDVSVQSQILNMLQELRDELNLTYIVITHDLAVVEHLATEIAVMYLGRIVERAETERFFGDPQHPYSRALLKSVMTPDTSLGIPELGLGTAFPDPANPPPGCAFHPRCAKRFEGCDRIAPVPVPRAGGGHVECRLFETPEAAGLPDPAMTKER